MIDLPSHPVTTTPDHETAPDAGVLRLYERVIESSFDIVVIVDAEGLVSYANPAVATLGYDPDELVGTSPLDFIHPDDVDEIGEQFERVDTGPGNHSPTIIRVRDSLGSWRWIEVSGTDLLDDPAVRGTVAWLREVTDRKRTEDALLESEARFRAVVLNSSDVTALADNSGVVIWASPNCEDLLGRTPEELVGTSGFDLLHPDDTKTAAERLATIFDPGRPIPPVTLRFGHSSGYWVPVEVAGSALRDDEGEAEGIIMNLRDVRWRLEAERALRESEERFRALVQHSADVIIVTDELGTITYASPSASRVFGREPDELVGTASVDLVHPDDLRTLSESLADPESRQRTSTITHRVIDANGDPRWVETTRTNLVEDAAVEGLVFNIRDITARVETEQDTQRLTDIFEVTEDLVVIVDTAARLLYANRAAREFWQTGSDPLSDELGLEQFLPEESARRFAREIEPVARRDGVWSGEVVVEAVDDEPVSMSTQFLVHRGADGEIEFYSTVMRDISERKRFEHELAHQATHDPLTGLPNRTMLLDRLSASLRTARRTGTRVAVLFLDLDHFKVVNDSLGHSLGDQLLMSIAERLDLAVRPGDTIARFGGDEFVLMCRNLNGPEDATVIADRVSDAISRPFDLGDSEVYVGASIGIALSDDETEDPETLIRDADAAMYRAKDRGRARFEIFDTAMRAHAVDRLEVEGALRRAIERRELRVQYQPIIDLNEGRLRGVEALVRWNHPQRGLLLPADFIGIAEETGLIVPIGAWVLAQACRQTQRWSAQLPANTDFAVTVNLSGRQLSHPRLVGEVDSILSDTGIDPDRVNLEITESVLMDDVELSSQTLARLRDLGVRLVVDDFGTGYSSLSYLRRFPVDLLKVDRSFVDGLGQDSGDAALVAAIVNLAHTLDLQVVAEGVETEDQLIELRRLSCDMAQGFHLARPLDPEALVELLRTDPTF